MHFRHFTYSFIYICSHPKQRNAIMKINLRRLCLFAISIIFLWNIYVCISYEKDKKIWKLEDVQDYRKYKVLKICQNVKKQGRANSSVISLYDPNLRVATCLISKAGSSTIASMFLALNGVETEDMTSHMYIHKKAKFLFNSHLGQFDDSAKDFQKSMRQQNVKLFSFVRHPFDRLVSGFQDRVDIMGSVLPEKAPMNKLRRSLNGSFQKFAEMVVDSKTRCMQSNFMEPFQNYCNFGLNRHWLSFQDTCEFCQIQYDYIGKLETFSRDMKYILQETGLWSDKLQKILNKKQNIRKTEKRLEAKKLISSLPTDLKLKLYQHYKFDFEMFDYDYKEFISTPVKK